jgi:membrane fusion protein (multidrug efflux system)
MDKKKKIVTAVASVALIGGAYFAYRNLVYVETDDAQVQAHFLMLSSRVNGTIQKVFVSENQKVKKGDVLAQIDTSDYSTASEAADSQVASLEARYKEAEINFKRATELLQSQAIPRERFDSAQAAYKDAGAKLKAAQAQAEQANLNVSYTKIVAPSDGTIARKSVEVGQFVSMGQPLFGFVDSSERWVTANLKETDLERVAPGKPVDIEVDALSSRHFRGQVESISPSTGAIFSLLPPDNATGNFTKVVQRVPVRIKLADLSPEDIDRLHAGLSAVVSIKVR